MEEYVAEEQYKASNGVLYDLRIKYHPDFCDVKIDNYRVEAYSGDVFQYRSRLCEFSVQDAVGKMIQFIEYKIKFADKVVYVLAHPGSGKTECKRRFSNFIDDNTLIPAYAEGCDGWSDDNYTYEALDKYNANVYSRPYLSYNVASIARDEKNTPVRTIWTYPTAECIEDYIERLTQREQKEPGYNYFSMEKYRDSLIKTSQTMPKLKTVKAELLGLKPKQFLSDALIDYGIELQPRE